MPLLRLAAIKDMHRSITSPSVLREKHDLPCMFGTLLERSTMYMQYTHPARSGQMGLACQVVSKKRGTANCKPWVLRILVDESQKKILKLIQKNKNILTNSFNLNANIIRILF